MSKSIFISCVFEDSHHIETIKSWALSKSLGDVVITHESEDKRLLGKEAIKLHIKAKIQGASSILVLIGQDTHNHDWIESEVELANSFHKQILCVRLPNTTGAAPDLLKKYRLIPFDPESIIKNLT